VFKLNMRKTVKKIAALVAGATMVGATIMGATALDLSNYPAPFVTNGVFSGKIVVGSTAMTSDVVGAIDVAASIQAAATTTTQIDLPGAAGKATVTGDSFEFGTNSDILGIGETLGNVRTTLLESDLKALKSGIVTTDEGSTPVKQYLKFVDGAGGMVAFEEDSDNDILADFLKFPDGEAMFEYQMDFTEGLKSSISDTDLEDLDSEVLNILGAPYTIVSATLDDGEIEITLLGGQVADTLKDGETKTYTIDGKDYEVTAVFISDDGSAKLSVNGMLTEKMDAGDTDILGEGEITIGVQEVLTNQREGIVEFYLGASKLVILDDLFTDGVWASECNVEIAGEDIYDCELDIYGTNTSSKATINHIYYRMNATDDVYVPAGKGLRNQLTVMDEQPESMLGANWDIVYAGLTKTGTTEIKFKPKGDKAYDLEFTNNRGQKYNFPLITNDNDIFVYGDDDDRIFWTESATSTDPLADNATFIPDDSYFVVSDKTDNTDEKAVTTVLRYKSISTSARTISVEDVGVGETKYYYTGTPGTNAEGNMNIAGRDHTFWVDTDGDYIAVDLDGDGGLTVNRTVNLMVKGEAYIVLPEQEFTVAAPYMTLDQPAGSAKFILTTPKEKFDDQPVADETTNVTVTNSTNEEVHLAVVGTSQDPDQDDWEYGMTDYGAYLKYNDPSGSTDAESLTIEYPLVQRSGQVFVTAGVVEVSEAASSTESGTISSTMLNPIGVGMAILDTDAESSYGTTKMIVVGGPCVNTIAAMLMGSPADCTEGFTPGKAVIKLFSDKNALLVAGYSAQDTVGACYVLGDYKDYNLAGTEVEVVVADLKNIVVNNVG
jgi:hypothetical protein